MEVEAVNCPNCGAGLQVDKASSNFVCNYCGSTIGVQRPEVQAGATNMAQQQQSYPVYTVMSYGQPINTVKVPPGVYMLIMNIAMPGLGSLIGGNKNNGIWQMVLFWGGVATSWLIIGLIPMGVAYVWAFLDGLKMMKEQDKKEEENNQNST